MSSQTIGYERRGKIAWITMDDGKANAINGALLSGVEDALAQAGEESCSAVVLVGRPGFFSAGLDLKTLPVLPRDELLATLAQFTRVSRRLLTFPRPIVAAITGHAIAGGAVLSLCCDHRIAALGEGKIGLNEAAIGIPLPTFVVELGRHRLSVPAQVAAMVHGTLYSVTGAHAIGFLDAVAAPDELAQKAQEAAERLGNLPHLSYTQSKSRLYAPLLAGDAELATAHELESFLRAMELKKPR
ncbi:MAG: crotonase/enoyl-CoA hydratase family protein [Candidatus Schekmanbacteria bacterium]|nr:crotonase/enoyl-CoA hydratase family protein [Candidatus Schekmanbacteria bacterium]